MLLTSLLRWAGGYSTGAVRKDMLVFCCLSAVLLVQDFLLRVSPSGTLTSCSRSGSV